MPLKYNARLLGFQMKVQAHSLFLFTCTRLKRVHYLHALMMCGVIITLTLITSSLLYRFLEVPARNYFKRVFNTRQPKILVESVEV